jgi:hypothetical protein
MSDDKGVQGPADVKRIADQEHKPQSGDRNLTSVAKQDKPHQDQRDKAIKEGEDKTDEASKRNEGVR